MQKVREPLFKQRPWLYAIPRSTKTYGASASKRKTQTSVQHKTYAIPKVYVLTLMLLYYKTMMVNLGLFWVRASLRTYDYKLSES